VPAPPIEEFVIGRLKECVISAEELDQLIKKANEDRDEDLVVLVAEEKVALSSRSTLEGKIAKLLDALEEGKSGTSIKRRLGNQEEELEQIESALATIRLKKDRLEERVLSLQVVADGYRDLPRVVDKLVEGKNWYRLKNVLQQYIEVIQWHEGESKEDEGRLNIVLFERPDAGAIGFAADEGKKEAPALSGKHSCAGANSWLLDLDLNQEPSG
jgi:hypothetical protein